MKLKYVDSNHAYYLDGKRCKGVTTLAKVPDDGYTLRQWEMRMVAIGMAKAPQLVEKVAVNFDDKAVMNDLAEEAKEVAGAFIAQNRGTTLHQVAERHDLGLELIDTTTNTAIRKAWQAALDAAGLEAIPEWIERIVIYPDLYVAGRFDRFLRRKSDGRLVVVDAKGGANVIRYPHAITVQLALYANAPLIAGPIPGSGGETTLFEERPDVDTEIGYVIHMPTDDHADLVPFNIKAGWECFNVVVWPTVQWRAREDLVVAPPLIDLLEQSLQVEQPVTSGSQDLASRPALADQTQVGTAPLACTPDLLGDTCLGSPLEKTGSSSDSSGSPPTLTTPTLISTGGSSTTKVRPGPGPDTPPPSKSSTSETVNSNEPESSSPMMTAMSSTTAPTETDLKARLREIHQHQPDLAHLIGRRWPPGVPAIRDDWDRQDVAYVAALLDEVDTEGPMLDEQLRISAVFDLLAPEQQARIKQWVIEAASDPTRYRPLALGAGNHTTRRTCLAETCLLIAGNEISDVSFLNGIHAAYGGPVPPIIGHALGQLNWRQAQHLLTLTQLHLNLSAEIQA